VHISLDAEGDRATIYLGDDRQSYEHGVTYLALTHPVEVQLGFEGEHRLVFVMVHPASKVLPAELLGEAEQESRGDIAKPS
jgi:hypothetical protein